MREIIETILNNWKISLIAIVSLLVLPFVASYYLPDNAKLTGYKNTLKVFFTNWVNIILIFAATYIGAFISTLISGKHSFSQALFGALYLVALYGIMFWIGFIVCVLILDIILFGFNREIKHTTLKLAIEWLIISSPFIYWLIKYNEWPFLIAILAFLLGQYLRRTYVIKILEK